MSARRSEAPKSSARKWLGDAYNALSAVATPYYHMGFIPAVIAVGMLCTVRGELGL